MTPSNACGLHWNVASLNELAGSRVSPCNTGKEREMVFVQQREGTPKRAEEENCRIMLEFIFGTLLNG